MNTHLERDSLSRLAAGELDAEESMIALKHVETCSECARELDFLADLVAAVDDQSQSGTSAIEAREPTTHSRMLVPALALFVVVIAARLVLRIPEPVLPSVHPEAPAYYRVALLADDDSPKARLDRAMTPYREADFVTAVKTLTEFLVQEPGHALARFYRGVCHQQLHDYSSARRDFLAAQETSEGFLQRHARWRLAQVAIQQDDPDRARELLGQLVQEGREFSLNAEQLLQDLP